MKIVVYFESPNNSYADAVATFSDEGLYHMCFGALEHVARQRGLIVTESVREDEVFFTEDREET